MSIRSISKALGVKAICLPSNNNRRSSGNTVNDPISYMQPESTFFILHRSIILRVGGGDSSTTFPKADRSHTTTSSEDLSGLGLNRLVAFQKAVEGGNGRLTRKEC